MHSLQILMIVLSLLMLLCVFASKYFSRLGIPAFLFFIGAGMVLGSDGIYGIYFNNPLLTREIGNIALCFIMFFGGMDLRWKSAQPIVGKGLILSTLGVFLTAFLVGGLATLVTGMPWRYALLLGAIVSSTDAASVFATLRSQKLELKGNVAPLLEFESGSNDPMAYMLTLTMLGIITHPQDSIVSYLGMFLRQFGLGAIIGVILGWSTVRLLNQIRHGIESMYLILGIALMLFTYGISSLIGGNSFLAVYLAGLIIGNSSFVRKTRLIRFFDGQSWLAQIILFLTLGLQVFPSRLIYIAPEGLIISFALIFIIRPLVVIPILSLFRTPFKQQVFISLVGFRGAASIVFATYPLTMKLAVAQDIFDIVFFMALSSILIQGTILKPIAKRLDILELDSDGYTMQTFTHYADEISDMPLLGVYVPLASPAIGKTIVELGLPEDIRIIAIRQKERYTTPKGDTVIHPGDRILLTSLGENSMKGICEKYSFES